MAPFIAAACFYPGGPADYSAGSGFYADASPGSGGIFPDGSAKRAAGISLEPVRHDDSGVGAVRGGDLFDAVAQREGGHQPVRLDVRHVGLYCLFRMQIRQWDDTARIVEMFALCSLVMAVFVGAEWATGKNPFAALGTVETAVREGRYRCQGSYPHSIILDCFSRRCCLCLRRTPGGAGGSGCTGWRAGRACLSWRDEFEHAHAGADHCRYRLRGLRSAAVRGAAGWGLLRCWWGCNW